MTLNEVVDKYFSKDRTIYFHSSDALFAIEGDSYLRWNARHNALWIGGDNGEVCLIVTTDPEVLDRLIKLIIFGK